MERRKNLEYLTTQAFKPYAKKVDELHQWAFNGTDAKLERLDDLVEPIKEHIMEAKIRREERDAVDIKKEKRYTRIVTIFATIAGIVAGIAAVKQGWF